MKRWTRRVISPLALGLLACLSAACDDDDEAPRQDASVDGACTDGSTADGSTADGSTQDGSTADGSTADGSTADGSTADGSTADGSTADGATADAGRDAGITDDAGRDAGITDDAGQDAGTTDDAGQDAALPAGPYGFTVRAPHMVNVPCSGPMCGTPMVEAPQIDYVCTLHYPQGLRYLYIQTRPVQFRGMGGSLYEVDGAWLSDGQTATAASATYDFGGNHHNDSVTLVDGDQQLRYYHSSFGFGWRACLPPDCLQVMSADGTLIDDGCTSERTRPEVCALVTETGAVSSLEDTFERCMGDEG